jgi:hypothetical protein
MWSTPGEGGPSLARETSPMCNKRELDSDGSGPTRSSDRRHSPKILKKD